MAQAQVVSVPWLWLLTDGCSTSQRWCFQGQRIHLPGTVSITYCDPKNRYILKCHSPAGALTQLAQFKGSSRSSPLWVKKIIYVCLGPRFSCQWPSALEVSAFGASGRQPVPESGWGSATKWVSPYCNWGISCLALITEHSLHFLSDCESWECTADKLEVRNGDGWV